MKAEGDIHNTKPKLRYVRILPIGTFLFILIGVCSNLFYMKTAFLTYDKILDASIISHQDNSTSLENHYNDDIIDSEEKIERQSFSSSRRQSHVVNYKLQSSKFIQILSDCITDEYCHIHYLHTGKTGGTTIETHFSNFFRYGSIGSCCGEFVKRQFQIPRREKRCLKEFISVQFNASDFTNIPIKSCLDVHANQFDTSNATQKHHIVALATFREPIAKTLSQVHQACNKNIDQRPEEVQAMCKRCDYDQDQNEWNRQFVDETNAEYASIYNDLILGTVDLGIPVLTIDSLDITPFFEGLKTSLPSEYASKLEDNGKIVNKEALHVCNFGVHSAMMKNLQSSFEVYRNLTLGW